MLRVAHEGQVCRMDGSNLLPLDNPRDTDVSCADEVDAGKEELESILPGSQPGSGETAIQDIECPACPAVLSPDTCLC